MTKIPNMITVLRIFGSAVLLLIRPLSAAFYIVYLICGVSDILDGYIARRSGSETALGATLDSIADLVFFSVMLVIFIPLIQWQWWILCLIGITAAIRLLSVIVGFSKYHALACLHTYANKASGALLFLFPFIYAVTGLVITAELLCSMAFLSSIEELVINIVSKELNRDARCIFDI